MKICGIYIIKSPSGKIYIGQSVDIKRRIKRYKYFGAKEQPYLNNSLVKYGFDNHAIEIIEECDRINLNEREKYYIQKYSSFNSEIGMNLTSGGCQNWEISESTRIKMKNRPKIFHSEETKKKISDSKIGKPAYNRRPVIDISTGIVYSHKKEAAYALGINVRTLKAKLEGKIKNNTTIRYV